MLLGDAAPQRIDVAIIGGGPAGLSTALALTRVLSPNVSMTVGHLIELPRAPSCSVRVVACSRELD